MERRMHELDDFTAYSFTIKSAFDMALFDIASKNAGLPLYKYLGGSLKEMKTDLTIGINEPTTMAETALTYKKQGVEIIKIKLGKNGRDDVDRVKKIREAVGNEMILRIDANQGWDFETALHSLKDIAQYNIQFCEQPMRYWDDAQLPELKKLSPVPIMADESVFTHYDAIRLIDANACSYINIKLAKSGGIAEATKINEISEQKGIKCMMGGMLESRLALSAFAHFATSHDNIVFYDMDTCLLGHKADPVLGGIRFNGYSIQVPETSGIGADIDESFLKNCESTVI
jgi:L-alanine-DL-glutamate epimerase-like enolase superfamily enzyme